MKKEDGAICNLCGESCALLLHGPLRNVETGAVEHDESWENEGLIEATVTGGYPSTPGNGYGALCDGDSYVFSICEFCLDFLFENANIPPTVYQAGGRSVSVVDGQLVEGPPIPDYVLEYTSASELVARDDWRTMKVEFYAERDRRAALRKIARRT